MTQLKLLMPWWLAVLFANALIYAYWSSVAPAELLYWWTVFSARVSFVLFLLSFGISSVQRLKPSALGKSLLRRRRQIGLSFALAHGIHLVVLIRHLVAEQFFPGWPLIIFGGIAYAFIAAMALTSNDAALRRLGAARWKTLHRTGSYFVAVIFLYVYLFRLLLGEYLAFSSVAFAALIAVLAARFLASRRRASTA